MANGFQTSAPASRHGTSSFAMSAGWVVTNKFTCPDTGTQEITEIGSWVSADSATTAAFRLAIFTDDAPNVNPDTMVANSESAELTHNTTDFTRKSHTYGTKPQLTGGTDYWLAIFAGDANGNVSRVDDATVRVLWAVTYPTWPTAAQWDSGLQGGGDYANYAVYQAAAGGSAIPVFMHHYLHNMGR